MRCIRIAVVVGALLAWAGGCSRSALEIDWGELPASVRQDAGAQPPPPPPMDAGVPRMDAMVPVPEAGVAPPDAGSDAALDEPPTIELISPLTQRSFYIGDVLRLEAACTAHAPAVVVESFWRELIAN